MNAVAKVEQEGAEAGAAVPVAAAPVAGAAAGEAGPPQAAAAPRS